MLECVINLENTGQENRDKVVFYASSSEIVYREGNYMKLASCSGEVLSQTELPLDHTTFELIDLGDEILFLFGGRTLVMMDKSETQPTKQDLDIMTIGKCCTPIFSSTSEDTIIFGTVRDEHLQFVAYDYLQKRRTIQTMSWAMSSITHVNVDHKDTLFAILDESLLVQSNMRTGETATRFETGKINRGFVPYESGGIYACQTCLRKIDGDGVETTRIPLVRVFTAEHIIGRNLYLTSKEGKNLCCYDLGTGMMKWEIFGNNLIHETLLAKGSLGGREYNTMIIRINDHIGVINLDLGKSVSYIKCPGVYRIRKTGDHIIANKINGTTMLIPSVEVEDDWDV